MEIKGIKEGILITIKNDHWKNSLVLLLEKIKKNPEFFRGARLFLDVGNSILKKKEIIDAKEKLKSEDVDLFGIISQSMVTQGVAQSLELITKLEKPKGYMDSKLKPLDTVLEGESAIFINRTLRSGYKVAYQGHVVVFGDINPGAEIIATGSIIVWGRLRGTVHAGSDGNQKACVCALDLSPTQLRIGSLIVTTPQDQAGQKPEMASIVNDQIIAVPWDHKKGD